MKVDLPFIDLIWRVRSSLPLEEDLTAAQAFDRLDPLFQTEGTHYTINGDTLTYAKQNPAAQDKLATFTHGTLQVTGDKGARVLRYDIRSTALWLCFLAPLLFVGLAYAAIGLNTLDPAPAEREEAAEEEEAGEDRELHWIDQMLGAPAPETKEEREKREAEEKAEAGEDGEDGEKETHSYKPAFVLAGIFALIYAVGRVLEPYLMRRTLRTALRGGFIATLEGPKLRDVSTAQPTINADKEAASLNDDRERRKTT